MRIRRELLWVYAAMPVLASIALLDQALLRGALRDALPASPAAVPMYGVVFGMPHIVASFFAYGDKNVWAPARALLIRATIAALLVIGFIDWLVSAEVAQRLLIVVTMIHVMGQQSGIALGAARLTGATTRCAAVWRWSSAAIACTAALSVGGELFQHPLLPRSALWMQLCGIALVLSSGLVLWLAKASRHRGGDTQLLFATQYMLVTGWLLIAFGYPLFGIVLLRFVHDATAFGFYVRFAAAREHTAPGANFLYRRIGLSGRAAKWAVLPLALLLSGVALMTLPGPLVLCLVLTHYAVEHKVWRSGGLLARHLPR